MEAANRARKRLVRSVGCNIVLPMEQRPNPYLIRSWSFAISLCKLMLAKYLCFRRDAWGSGTLDELFEIATLVADRQSQGFRGAGRR
jgi:predicted Rossmann-fold nucleotide-binding protein